MIRLQDMDDIKECKHRIAEIIEYWSESGSSILYKRICKRCKQELPHLTWASD